MAAESEIKDLQRRIDTLEKEAQRHKIIERSLSESRHLYRAVVENSHDGIIIIDSNFRIVYANQQLKHMLGVTTDELIGEPFIQFVDEADRHLVVDRYSKRQRGESVENRYEFSVIRKDGEKRNVEVCSSIVEELPDGPHTVAQLLDITDRKQDQIALKESYKKYQTIVEYIEDGYFEADLDGNLVFFNDSICEMLGYTRDELNGRNYRQYMDKDNSSHVLETFHRIYATGNAVKAFDWEIVRKDGGKRFMEASVSPLFGADGQSVGFCGIVRDVSKRKKYEQQLAYQAAHDMLTGLYNRQSFMDRLEDSLRYAKRYGMARAVLFIDIDNFKMVNDRFGHEVGDALLKEMAERLRQSLRETDYVCRLGGDEFTVILSNPVETHPEIVAQRIVESVSQPYFVKEWSIDFLTASVGISSFPLDGQEVDILIKHADQAMYKAKEEGNRYICYMEIDPTRKLAPTSATLQ